MAGLERAVQYDVFFSISQTPAGGVFPTEADMFQKFFAEVEAADALGYETAWIAQSHLSSEVQKRHKRPVIPHWEGEIGLNVDIFQLAHHILNRTESIEVGSAVANILTMGGPIAAAERLAYFATLRGLTPDDSRRLHLGFAAGRFDFMNRAAGVVARDAVEQAAGRAMKGKTFDEAAEIFCRLVRGDILSSEDIAPRSLSRDDFRSDEDWDRVLTAHGTRAESIELERRYVFEPLQIVPRDWQRERVQLIVGSHDPRVQIAVNRFRPVQVFNLSITQADVIEATHDRMTQAYHPDGGPWRRSYMPRTSFVFLNEDPGCSPEERRARAHQDAKEALSAYWKALEGTLDPSKVTRAADNALVGNAEDVANQIVERFHPEDRLMLWFDFFQHDESKVIKAMTAFQRDVVPRVTEALAHGQ